MSPQSLRQRGSIGELHNAGRQVMVGIVLAVGNHLTNPGKEPAEIESVHTTKKPMLWTRKLEDGHPSARLHDPYHFGQATIGVGDVAQAKGNGHDLKGIVRKRQALSISFQKTDSLRRSPSFGLLDGGQ